MLALQKVMLWCKKNAGILALLLSALFAALMLNAYYDEGRDFSQMLLPLESFSTGDFSNVYPETTKATSLIVWLVLSSPLYIVLKPLLGATVAFSTSTTIVSVALLVTGMRCATKSIYPEMKNERVWLLSALPLLLPTTISGWHEFYHPQDIAGLGLMLFGLGFAAQKRWALSALFFGLGTLTRQWVALSAVVASGFTKKFFIKFWLIGFSVLAVGTLPFLLVGNEGFGNAVFPPATSFLVDQTMFGLIASSFPIGSTIFRLLPFVVAASIAVYVLAKKLDQKTYLVPLVLTALIGRQFFEVAPLTYYWIPIAAMMLLLNQKRSSIIAAFVFSFAVIPIGSLRTDDQANIITSFLFLFSSLAAFAITWMLYDETPQDGSTKRHGKEAKEILRQSKKSIVVVGLLATAIVTTGVVVLNVRLSDTPETREVPLEIGSEIEVGTPVVGAAEPGIFPTVEGERPSGITSLITPNGEPQIVAFWVHWCEQCIEDARDFVQWVKTNGINASVVLGPVDSAKGNAPQRVWLLSIPWEGPTIVDDAQKSVLVASGAEGYPAYLVFDGDGRIVDLWQGNWDAGRATQALNKVKNED